MTNFHFVQGEMLTTWALRSVSGFGKTKKSLPMHPHPTQRAKTRLLVSLPKHHIISSTRKHSTGSSGRAVLQSKDVSTDDDFKNLILELEEKRKAVEKQEAVNTKREKKLMRAQFNAHIQASWPNGWFGLYLNICSLFRSSIGRLEGDLKRHKFADRLAKLHKDHPELCELSKSSIKAVESVKNAAVYSRRSLSHPEWINTWHDAMKVYDMSEQIAEAAEMDGLLSLEELLDQKLSPRRGEILMSVLSRMKKIRNLKA